MSKHHRKNAASKAEKGDSAGALVFYPAVAMLVLVPLAFSTSLNAKYALPKFAVLLVGSSLLTVLLVRPMALSSGGADRRAFDFKSPLVRIVILYLMAVSVSTLFGVAPLVSFFGTNSSFMGLITRLCFVVCCVSLIVGISASERRLLLALRAMALAGFLVSAYAVAQFFGVEPFGALSAYTFDSTEGTVIRVCSSLGHSNYLGNFLLYTTPLTLGLAFASRDKARLLAGMAVPLSVAAIVFSGSRGAWLGIIVGFGVFAALELKAGAGRGFLANKRRLALVSGAAVVTLVVAGFMISRSPSFRSISERARTLMTEGLSSSGRVLLWRDSIRMIPRYALIGCGPEGFRKALLAYKSVELAALSPKANNESPHNAYLEAAISYGLLGAALYVLIIAYAIVLLWRARRNATSGMRRIIVTGVMASFIAVLVHNFFIFDQIATGLYFFAFIAVAFVSPGTIGTKSPQDNVVERKLKPHPRKTGGTVRWRSLAVNSVAGVVVASSVWYCFGLFRAELAYKKLFDPLHPLDYQGMLQEGVNITNSPLPTGAYDFLYAGALEQAVQRIPTPSSTRPLQPKDTELAVIRSEVLRLGISHAERSVEHTNTPDMNYSLLASLALAAGDVEKATAAAAKAVQWDPNNYHTRWLMAEAHLARGENEQAIREAETSIQLYPRSLEAASTLSRARGGDGSDDTAAAAIIAQARNNRPYREHAAEELVEAARRISRSGNQQEARIKLLTAIGRSDGACPACHRELALVLEKMGRIKDAIAEWETYVKEDEAGAAAERVAARIESLRQRSETKP